MAGFFDAMHTLSTLEVDVIKRDRVVDKLARDVNINRVTSFVVKAAKRQLDSVPPRALSPPSFPLTASDNDGQLPSTASVLSLRGLGSVPPYSVRSQWNNPRRCHRLPYAPCMVFASGGEHLPPSPSPTLLRISSRNCLLNPLSSNPTPFRLPTHSRSLPLSLCAIPLLSDPTLAYPIPPRDADFIPTPMHRFHLATHTGQRGVFIYLSPFASTHTSSPASRHRLPRRHRALRLTHGRHPDAFEALPRASTYITDNSGNKAVSICAGNPFSRLNVELLLVLLPMQAGPQVHAQAQIHRFDPEGRDPAWEQSIHRIVELVNHWLVAQGDPLTDPLYQLKD
ncbi:hypothetical protein R3P38DRAFT_3493594 [Favolaschia claudopus]|uniref:Uncharacterized protein n=1 Tax=Favolaschia claudopus TaxID=2862362 RepID=A0AAW0C6S3_9AGAR